jgi:glycosyltransferase involved in cell wall biosynthesis
LKIAVNTRMLLEKGTGVPNYIGCLYEACLKLDQVNQYIFFQPNRSRTLGQTMVAGAPPGLAGAAWFDSIQTHKLIRQSRPNIFHAPSHILPLRKLRGVKHVVTIHDLAFRVFPEHYDWKHRIYYGWQVARSVRLADCIVADSHNTKRDIIRFYRIPPERIKVVHLAVAGHYFQAAETQQPRPVAEKYFLAVTTHPKRKNVLGALRAFATFASQSDVTYVVAGPMNESQQRESLALASQLGVRDRVRLWGYADGRQMALLYQNAEFTIYPSFYEGFGMPVAEAMACRCPVITSNTSSLPEIMPDGDWLVNPHDIGDMASKMQRMLALSPEARRRIGERNQQHARLFTWEKAARQMIEIFETLHPAKS